MNVAIVVLLSLILLFQMANYGATNRMVQLALYKSGYPANWKRPKGS